LSRPSIKFKSKQTNRELTKYIDITINFFNSTSATEGKQGKAKQPNPDLNGYISGIAKVFQNFKHSNKKCGIE
jgi:hypothetical protein